MFKFVFQKILSKKWMILSLLIGNILLISIVSASPIYSNAVLQRTLLSNFNQDIIDNNRYPGNIQVSIFTTDDTEKNAPLISYYDASFAELIDELDLPIVNDFSKYFINSRSVLMPDEEKEGEFTKNPMYFGFMSGIKDHSEIISGEMYSDDFEENGSIGVIVSESTLIKQQLFVGETYFLDNLSDENGNPYSITIKGVFENSNENDIYWTLSPTRYNDHLFMSEELFRELFVNMENPSVALTLSRTIQIDYTEVKSKDVTNISELLIDYYDGAENLGVDFTANFDDILLEHQKETERLNVTLLVLQVPIYILLAVFIFMVSRQMIESELTEIAVFKSRGASKGQILKIYLIQSMMISVVSLIVGLPFGFLLCQVLGSSNAFLEFVNRAALPATLNIEAIIYSLFATILSIITMVTPAVKHANVGIVVAKRQKQQNFTLKWWEKIGLDIVLLGVSLYGLYSFESQKEFLAQRVQAGASLDPVLFLNSSVFIIGAGLLALRIFPWLMKLLFFVGKKKWSPSIYVSFRRVIGSKDNQGFIMVFLIMTIALGIFNSVSARTINTNEENRIRYEIGADIVVKELWASTDSSMGGLTSSTDAHYIEPDFDKYNELEGAESYTKVLTKDNISVSTDKGNFKNTELMAIHTKEFGESAYMQEGLLDNHWYEYLNVISQNPEAVLLSKNAQDEFGLQVGDSIYYSDSENNSFRGIIHAFVDYWPTYNDITITTGVDGVPNESNHYLIVAHLSYIQSVYTNTPYEIWFNMEDSSKPFYDFSEEFGIDFTKFEDFQAELTEQKNDPIFQGTNGILTVGFMMILALCAVGFLIYWILSISSRQLQFGIFRAMGMSMREIVFMLVFEQICVSGYAVLIGSLVGFVSSRLFVPLIEISYAATEQSIPLEIVVNTEDNIRIFAVIGFMIALCLSIISVMISRMKIAQALKLGED